MFNYLRLSLTAALLLPAAGLFAEETGAPTNDPVSTGEPATKYHAGLGVIPATITSPLGRPMNLKWNDEFNPVPDTATDGKPYIDRSRWQTTFWQGGSERTLPSNGETQYYMDKDYAGKNNLPLAQRPNPFSFETPGILTISATKTPETLWGNYGMSKERCITSGLLCSDRRYSYKYGYIEGRFKVPMTRGSWPGMWLLPDDIPVNEQTADPKVTTGQWYKDKDIKAHPWPPEIDVIEALGIWRSSFDTGYIAPKGETVKVSHWLHNAGADLSNDFHTWGMEWDENNMVWTFDGKIIAHGKVTPSFRRPFYILVQLAAGGNWYSQVMNARRTPYAYWQVDTESMPWKMECDYVRVYQADPSLPPSELIPDSGLPGAGHHNGNGTAPVN